MATETVTVTFTDLVASTDLLSRLGEDVAAHLRREHFELLRSAVHRHAGREVKNLGDGLMAVFASSADAVAAAVDVQRAFDRRNRGAPEPLVVRIGISAGDAEVDDGDYFGMPVVEAARLCGEAEAEGILVTDVVRLMTGGRGFAFESLGELELRGIHQPVQAHRVTWEPDGAPLGPLPARLAAAASEVFVARELERAQLAAMWKAVTANGERRLALVSGEPGIGNTTLAAQLAAEVHAGGAVVAYGRCDEDLGIPYQPWIQVTANVTVQPSVAHHLGILDHCLGRHDDAARWFATATALHERMESRLFVAVTGVAHAALLADVGDAARAGALAGAALRDAEAGGYGRVAADAAAVLERVG